MIETHGAEPDDQQLIRYWLGPMPEEESERLDEASVVDQRVAWRLRALEDDLIDAYVCDALDHDTRRRFERVYLASLRRRERVAFAARFLAALDRGHARGAAVTKPSLRQASIAWWRLAVPAALLLACCVLFFQSRQPPTASIATVGQPVIGGGRSW